MSIGFHSIWDMASHKRAVQRWARAAGQAGVERLSILRKQSVQARLLRAHLDKLIASADERLALPVPGSASFPKPHNADWAWRPIVWRRTLPIRGLSSVQNKAMLGDEITLFHDCGLSELTLRQLRNTRVEDLAPYGLRLDVFQFDGSFLSVVVDLPAEAVTGLKRAHILRVDCIVEMERRLEIFARLNIQHGPNTEQIVRELPLQDTSVTVEFDLAYSSINEKRVEKAWIDFIFEGPEMNQITLRDLTFSRRPRAQI